MWGSFLNKHSKKETDSSDVAEISADSNKKKGKSSKGQNDLCLILDIRSSSVGGSLIKLDDGPAPIVLNTAREYFFFEKKADPEEFVSRTELATEKILDLLLHKNPLPQKIRQVDIFYGAPWYEPYVQNFTHHEKNTITLTSEYFNRVIRGKLDKMTRKEEILEKDILSISINGYQTRNPFNKKASDFEASFYFSIINKKVRRGFEKIVRKFISHPKIKEHTHPTTIYSVLKNKFHNPNNYLLIDITGELSELAIVQDGRFQKIISTPFGVHDFVRKIMEITGHDRQTAFSALSMVCKSETDSNYDSQMANLVTDLKREWLDTMKDIVEKFEIQNIPQTIYISADQEIKEIMEYILNDVETYASVLKIGRKPNVHFMGQIAFANLCLYSNEDIRKDAQLAIEAVFVELKDRK